MTLMDLVERLSIAIADGEFSDDELRSMLEAIGLETAKKGHADMTLPPGYSWDMDVEEFLDKINRWRSLQ